MAVLCYTMIVSHGCAVLHNDCVTWVFCYTMIVLHGYAVLHSDCHMGVVLHNDCVTWWVCCRTVCHMVGVPCVTVIFLHGVGLMCLTGCVGPRHASHTSH
ncbi:hypothetical protein FKM82_028855 [Ascaphus truei]